LLSDTEPDLLNDAIYYSFLLRSCPLTKRFGEELIAQVIRLLQGAEWKEAYRPLAPNVGLGHILGQNQLTARCGSPVENIPLLAEHHSGRRAKMRGMKFPSTLQPQALIFFSACRPGWSRP
jgi:hypothetical protein